MTTPSVVLFVALLVPLAFAADITVDICVIGAGPSGIQAAYTAEAKGYSVAVIEKNNYVGGGTKTIRAGSGEMEYFKGAIVHDGTKTNSLEDLFKKFDVPAIGSFDVRSAGGMHFYSSDGAEADYSLNYLGLFLQGLFHVFRRRSLERQYAGPEGLLSDYPKELNEPLYEWLKDNNMSSFQDVFWIIWTAYGYGDTRDSPAVYGLKALAISSIWGLGISSIPIIGGLFKNPHILYPYQQLLEKWL